MANERLRIVVVLTGSAPIRALWETAVGSAEGGDAEIIALYIDDEQWQRAASLPFTREISRTSGKAAEFTRLRAEQLARESVEGVRRQLAELASLSRRVFEFEVLSGSGSNRVQQILREERCILVAHSPVAELELFAEFRARNPRIVLIDGSSGNGS